MGTAMILIAMIVRRGADTKPVVSRALTGSCAKSYRMFGFAIDTANAGFSEALNGREDIRSRRYLIL